MQRKYFDIPFLHSMKFITLSSFVGWILQPRWSSGNGSSRGFGGGKEKETWGRGDEGRNWGSGGTKEEEETRSTCGCLIHLLYMIDT